MFENSSIVSEHVLEIKIDFHLKGYDARSLILNTYQMAFFQVQLLRQLRSLPKKILLFNYF